MKKKYIVKNNYDFERIINKKDIIKNSSFIIYKEENNLNYPRFGISVGKKLGNAVYRNKMKRRIRNIIDSIFNDIKDNNDFIIILRKKAQNYDYNNLEKELTKLFIK